MSVNGHSPPSTKTFKFHNSPKHMTPFKVIKRTKYMSSYAKIPPASFSKYFKTTPAAQKLMDPEGRLCELDRNSHERELVYSKYPRDVDWDEMKWSQAKLFDRAQQDSTLRISRKKPYGMQTFEIFQRDFFNEPELSKYADKPNMNASVTCISLGFMQARRDWIYILSKRGETKDDGASAATIGSGARS